jgi:UDP-N-acetylmuramyl pentapeptide phosphotransferase/UDP-N-acetylglucosamine-1-phosphate transferase
MNFQDIILNLENWGVAEVLLPFLLIFTLVFAILQKTKILGQDKDGRPRKNFNIMIALVLGLSVVIPHVINCPYRDSCIDNPDVVTIMNNALPNVSIVLVAIFMMLLLIGIFSDKFDVARSVYGGFIVIAAAVLIFLIFGIEANWFGTLPDWLNFLHDPETQATVIIILVFGIIVWFITKEDKPKDQRDENKALREFTKMIGDGGRRE